MKLIIQIPCYNEEANIAETLACLPRRLPGVDTIEWLIIDDGSTDGTVAAAKAAGADHVVSLKPNKGLARAFMAGLNASLRAGADIIVNTDADNQYNAGDIPKLIQPIINGQADFVIGARPIRETTDFSAVKRFLQMLGSWVVRKASGTDIPDAPSGFRAMNRKTALCLNVFDNYTYTLETIIQAGAENMEIVSVPIRTNPVSRQSRLVKSVPSYVKRSMATIVRSLVFYRPFHFFSFLGAAPFVGSTFLAVRWLVLYWGGTSRAHVPSLVVAAVLAFVAFQCWFTGLVLSCFSTQRRMLAEVQRAQRGQELGGGLG
ncbi:glycosyl transferase family 2 [Desulfarculus baarsii DSM 2075]|uniref:Glycosyl transferase family 2 n=1 Tax=Desulfarculus baarsii (strain ATCC 33931 / DSM 2075 / LMG 7858 / VKM B-1802 / 2st14) TaxID=644282 RepID=E1QKP7_DESB2|nr:glycosyltransferase family 2 protein [Desulfarculus baarsii]ADK86256.1 glycosyl transferase family 2 [Desulfarculus baarsii DSM 2075]